MWKGCDPLDNRTTKVYSGIDGVKFGIVISDVGRKVDKNAINATCNFYRKAINDWDFAIVKQSDDFDVFGQITLEGNAKANYKELIGSEVSLSHIRMLNNNYYFMANSANRVEEPFLHDMVFIRKTLSVSANGNVFPGCLMSYDNVDKNPMFNIMDCNKDFFKHVNNFCWEHPLNEKALST